MLYDKLPGYKNGFWKQLMVTYFYVNIFKKLFILNLPLL